MPKFLLALLLSLPFTAFAQVFDGSWRQDCQTSEDDVLQISLHVNHTTWTWQGVGFDKENCIEPYLKYEETYIADKFEYLGQNEYNLDLITKEIIYTPLTDEVAEALNLIAFCGQREWAVNVKTVVTGLVCEDRFLRKTGERYFQKVGIENDALLWGQVTVDEDGATKSRRPSAFENLPFKK